MIVVSVCADYFQPLSPGLIDETLDHRTPHAEQSIEMGYSSLRNMDIRRALTDGVHYEGAAISHRHLGHGESYCFTFRGSRGRTMQVTRTASCLSTA